MLPLFFILLLATTASALTPAYCTYHMYQTSTPLSTLSCSDGSNGLLNWNYQDLNAMYPYVTAWQSLSWNNPNCGTCLHITANGKSVYVTAVDQCGPSPVAGSQHFDMGPDAFLQLFGNEGVNKGTMMAEFQVVDSTNCKGNKKSAGKTITTPIITTSAPVTIKTVSTPTQSIPISNSVKTTPAAVTPVQTTSVSVNTPSASASPLNVANKVTAEINTVTPTPISSKAVANPAKSTFRKSLLQRFRVYY